MTTAEGTAETFIQAMPNAGVKMIYIIATTTNAADFITVSGLTTIQSWYLRSSDTVAAGSNATNVITLSNGATGAKVWYGWATGV